MLILTENDELHEICQRLLNIKRVSFADMNGVLASTLVNSFLPARDNTSTVHVFNDGIQHLCGHPMFKMISVKSIPQVHLLY
jgi:tubulin delta